VLGQIEAVERTLAICCPDPERRRELEDELALLYEQRWALLPPESEAEVIRAAQLRHRRLRKPLTGGPLPEERRPVEDLVVALAERRARAA
jgi:hypothetical protein